MNKVRMILTDLDGTLLQEDHITVPPRTREAIAEAKRQGILLCACTGRCYHLQADAVFELGFDYAITSNGAACTRISDGKKLFTVPLSAEKARFAWNILKPWDPVTEWFVDGGLLLDRHNFDRWEKAVDAVWHRVYLASGRTIVVDDMEAYFAKGAPGLEKITIFRMPAGADRNIIAPIRESGLFEAASSLGTNLEVSDIEADKGKALVKLCGLLGIDPSETVAFGDGSNDISFMKAAGIAVAMDNAVEKVKACADAVTLSNTDEGVADYLFRHIL